MASLTKHILIAAALMSLLPLNGLYAQPKSAQPQAAAEPAEKPTDIVARVNGKEINREALDIAASNLMPYMSFHQSVSDERLMKIKKTALEKLIEGELVYRYAKEQKLDSVTSKEIDSEVDKLKKKLPKGETLDKVLKRSKMTIADLKEDLKKSIVIARVSKKKYEEFQKKSEATVNDAFMKDYYQKNLAKFKEPEQINLRTILLKADPSGGQKVWNEVHKKAQEIAKRIKGGEDFATLAKSVSEDPYAKNGGDMGWSHRGSLFQEIEEAVSKLKVGEVSDPIMTMYGYHIVRIEALKPSVQKKFDDLNKENLKKELEQKELKRLNDDWKKGLRDAAKIEYLIEFKQN